MAAPETPPRRLDVLLDVIPLALAGWIVWAVLATWAARIGHPFDLEWMEGGMLGHAWRLQQGLPLYPEPGPDWIPYIYPPGYSAVLAALGGVAGLSYALARGLSIAATLAAAGALVVLGGRHGGSAVVGLCGAAVFLGCYRASGAFYDLARPDSLSLALAVGCVLLAADGRRGTAVAAGLMLAAAFTVKHNLAMLGVPLSLALWARSGWREGLRFGLWSALPAGAFTVWMQWRTGGLFLRYLLEVPASHPMVLDRATFGTVAEVGRWLAPALVASAAWITVSARRRYPGVAWWAWLLPAAALGLVAGMWASQQPAPRGVPLPAAWVVFVAFAAVGWSAGALAAAAVAGLVTRRVPWRWWLGMGCAATLFVVAAVMRGHHGGFLNVMMPAHWAACAGLVLAIGRTRQARPGWITSVAATGALSLQLAWIGSELDTDGITPGPQDVAAGERVLDELRARCPGPILSPYAAWMPVQAGQPPSIPLIALWDLNHKRGPFVDDLTRMNQAAADHHWSCVVVGGSRALGYRIPEHYESVHRFDLPPKALIPKTGWRVRPREILVPRRVER